MQQQDSGISRSIAIDSKKLAEASTHDSSSMKAIAVLTMVFLPSTAVAVGPLNSCPLFFNVKSNRVADDIQYGPILRERITFRVIGLLALLGDQHANDCGGFSRLASMA